MKHLLILAALMATGQLYAQTITIYRWWINDDIATLTTASIAPATEANLIATLDLPPLTKDHNTITLQFKDNNDEWSVPRTTWFTKRTGAVNGYEYWINDAITNATTGAIGPNTIVDLIDDLPTGLPGGTHTFTIRFSGASGTWSVPLTTSFSSTVGLDELPGISDLLLFPNPVNDALGLRLNAAGSKQLYLQLLDAQGRVIRDLPTWITTGSGYRNWDISDLSAGSYLLRISDGNGATSMRFVKP